MPTFESVDTFYQPEDFNVHLYLSKKKKLVDPKERTEILKNLIQVAVGESDKLEHVRNQISAQWPTEEGANFESTHIQSLRNCLGELKCDESVDVQLSAKFDRLIFELDVCLELMASGALVESIGVMEQEVLTVQYKALLENEFLAAVRKIKHAADRAGATTVHETCIRFKGEGQQDLTWLEKTCVRFGNADVLQTLEHVLYASRLTRIVSAHKSNLKAVNEENYIGKCADEAYSNKDCLNGGLDRYLAARNKLPGNRALLGVFNIDTSIFSCFGGFSKSEKQLAQAALVDALAGKPVDLRPHLGPLSQGNLRRAIEKQVKVGDMDGLVGQHCSTVGELVAALVENNGNNFSRNVFSVAQVRPKP